MNETYKKVCTQCKASKPISGFYVRNKAKGSFTSYCKECYKKYDTVRYYSNREKRLKEAREAYANPEVKKRKLDYSKRYIGTVKWVCRQATRNAVAAGKLIKKNCEVCDDPNVEAHHSDYGKPLEVNWLCIGHHKRVHRKRNPIVAKESYMTERT